jgi:hypothetical protein
MYYRPGAIALFALVHVLIGANPVALHALSLLLTVVVVWIFGRFLYAWRQSTVVAWSGMALLLTHPFWSTSTTAWITNHMHLVEAGLVLGACWLAVVTPDRWPWLLILQACALTVKEDAIMLAPSLAILWWSQRVRIPRPWIIGSGIVSVVWAVARWLAGSQLHIVVAYSRWAATVGPPAIVTIGGPVSLILIAIMALMAISSLQHEWRALVSALALVALWNLPLLYATGPTRWQFLTLWTVTAIAIIVESATRRDHVLASALTLTLAAHWTVLNIVITKIYFAPCGTLEEELLTDQQLTKCPEILARRHSQPHS